MANVKEKDLLDEIRFDIKARDLLKAKLVLASLEHVGRKVQKQALFEVSRAGDEFAIPLLAGVIANSPDISNSFPQIKETMFSRILDKPEILLQLLSDSTELSIKHLLIDIAGEIRLLSAVPLLIEMLLKEQDRRLIKAVISALLPMRRWGGFPLIKGPLPWPWDWKTRWIMYVRRQRRPWIVTIIQY